MSDSPVPPPERWRRTRGLGARLRRALPFIGGALAALVAVAVYDAIRPQPAQITLRDVNDTVARAMASATPPPPYSVAVREIIRPSLVLVETDRPGEGVADDGAEADRSQGLGTGVVVSDRGDILTSLHVVDGAERIDLTFADGSKSPAEIVAAQPENDIAVLRALQPPPVLIPATLGNPGGIRVGDEAFVVGHPLGLYGSMSAGVISGLERSYEPENGQRLDGLIQFDAAVNPGNSGGPLLNRYGQVVGIVAGLVNPTDQNVFIGIGFAVPINVAGAAAGVPAY